jgi:hypothetical protein
MTQVDLAVLISAVFTLSLLYLLWPKSTTKVEPIEIEIETPTPAKPADPLNTYYVQMYCCGLLLTRCADDSDGRDGERMYTCIECGRELLIVVRKQVTEARDGSRNYAGARG